MRDVTPIQLNLKGAGYDPGVIDGLWGMHTLHAFICYMAGRAQTAETLADARALAREMAVHAIVTRLSIIHLIANIVVETRGFRDMAEDMTYRDPARLDALFSAVHGIEDARALIARGGIAIANRVYAGRNGNGDEASGDGYRYRGHGYLMHTGLANMRWLAGATGLDLVAHPDILLSPDGAAMAACTWWVRYGLTGPAERDDARGVRRIINPALVGLSETTRIADRAKRIWRA